MTTKESSREPRARVKAVRTPPTRLPNADVVFADPVEYLRRLGLESELVGESVGTMLPAA